MTHRPCLWLFVTGAALLALAPFGGAQTFTQPSDKKPARGEADRGLSHRLINLPPHGPGTPIGDFLRQRLEQARERDELQKLLQEVGRDPEKHMRREDAEAFRKLQQERGGRLPDLDDPQARELLKRWLEDQEAGRRGDGQGPQLQLDPKQLEGLRDLLARPAPDQDEATPPAGQPRPEGGLPQPPDLPRDGPLPDMPEGPRPPEGRPDLAMPRPQPPQPPSADALEKGFQRFVEKLRDSSGSLRDSQTLRQLGRDLGRRALERQADGGASYDPDAPAARLARLGETLHFDRLGQRIDRFWNGYGENAASYRLPHLPSLLRLDWPNGSAVGGAPAVSTADGPSGGTWAVLIWLVAAAAGAYALWKLLTTARRMGSASADIGWRLGPWPVNPAGVATRQDLVRAFEYLSLLLLGPAARAWNHVEIAARLGAADRERRRMADHLAALYEQARYAPGDEPLPAADLDGARHELCLLAGVASA